MNGLERRPDRLPAHRLARRALGAAVTLGAGTLIVTLAIDQPISIDISGKVEGRASVIIGTPQAVDQAIRELPPVQLAWQAAFPGAEGYGAQTTWGLKWGASRVARAGILPLVVAVAAPNDSICDRSNANIHFVTNLNDSGSGSLRQAISDTVNDTLDIIAFRVAGYIDLTGGSIRMRKSCVYVAGQSAPGDGITLMRQSLSPQADNIILRFIRQRIGGGGTTSALQIWEAQNVIVDHVSLSWATFYALNISADTSDGNPSADSVRDVTVQWSFMGEIGDGHPVCVQNSGLPREAPNNIRISLHHNYQYRCSHRNPNNITQGTKVTNNVSYNINQGFGQGQERSAADWINNYFKVGPIANGNTYNWEVTYQHTSGFAEDASYYAEGNVGPHNADSLADNDAQWRGAGRVVACWYTCAQYTGIVGDTLPLTLKRVSPLSTPTVPVTSTGAYSARDLVVDSAGMNKRLNADGSWTVVRDSVDTAWATFLADSTGHSSLLVAGSIQPGDSNYPTLDGGSAYTDSDSDGMPDTWETANGLDPNDASDMTGDPDGDGYINVEEFLNGTDPT